MLREFFLLCSVPNCAIVCYIVPSVAICSCVGLKAILWLSSMQVQYSKYATAVKFKHKNKCYYYSFIIKDIVIRKIDSKICILPKSVVQ